MECLICKQAEMCAGSADIPLMRGEFRLDVGNVPALICPQCGEIYLNEDVAQRLLQAAEKIYAEGGRMADMEWHEDR